MTKQSIKKQTPNISPSAISRFYDDNYCGKAYFACVVEKSAYWHTESMQKGKVFEYQTLGATSQDGEVPALELLKSGKPSADQKAIDGLTETFNEVIEGMQIEVLETQIRLEKEGHTGVLDMLCNIEGKKSMVDLKYTETKSDDRWSPFAMWGALEHKDHTQPIHYIWLYHLMHGEYLPFYYMVFGKSGWIKVIKVEVSAETMVEHELKMEQFAADVTKAAAEGWAANPERERCAACPLFETCQDKHTMPTIQTISV